MLHWYLSDDATLYNVARQVLEEKHAVTQNSMRLHLENFTAPALPEVSTRDLNPAFKTMEPVPEALFNTSRWNLRRWTNVVTLEERQMYRTRRTLLQAYVQYLIHGLRLNDVILDQAATDLLLLSRKEWAAAVRASVREREMGICVA